MATNRRAALLAFALVSFGALSAHAQTTFVQDTFTVGANTLVEAHTPNTGGAWTRFLGGSGITINGAADNVRNVAATDWNEYGNATTPPGAAAEIVVGITVTFTNNSTNNFVDIWGRGSVSLLNGYIARVRASNDGTGTNVQIISIVGGTLTIVASASRAISLNVAHAFLFSIKNASKEIWIDGVLVTSTTNNVVPGTGLVGFGMQSNVAAQTIADNYFASTFAPTAVRMTSMSATRDNDRALIEWSTGQEAHNLGFRIWRGQGDDRELVTPQLIAGSALFVAGGELASGNNYRWVDGRPGQVYWIEEIDLNGTREWHGPIVAKRGAIDPSVKPTPILRDLGQRNSVATPARLRPASLGDDAEPVGRRRAAGAPGGTLLRNQFEIASQRAVKIPVTAAGLYRVAQPDLLNAGLDPDADPRTLRIFEDGAEIPIFVEGEDDGRLDAGDSVTFYGTPLDTQATGTRTYWLVWGATRGTRTSLVYGGLGVAPAHASFPAVVERRDKTIFFPALRNGDADSFFGPVITNDPGQTTSQGLSVSHIDRSVPTATLEVAVQGVTDFGMNPDHRVLVTLNGHALPQISFLATDVGTGRFEVPTDWIAEGNNNVELVAVAGPDDINLVVSVRLTYAHTYVADDNQLIFTAAGGSAITLTGFSSSHVRVLDVTDTHHAIELPAPPAGDGAVSIVATGSGTHTFVAVGSDHYLRPARLDPNEPSALNASAGADEVIIVHPSFASAIEPLRKLRESQGLSVVVAKVDDVYDEFNFGAKDPAAIRAFLAWTRSWKTTPRFVLLVGDASFDERNYLGMGDFDFVPTKLIDTALIKTSSDSWLADFDSDGSAEMAIGRLPVRTLAEATIEVGKIVSYENAAPGMPWSRSVLLVSDTDPVIAFDESNQSVREHIPAAYNVSEIDVARTGAPAARATLIRDLNDGALVVNFIGHGSVELWTSSFLFTRTDALQLTNAERLPLVIAMTCLNGYFHDMFQESLAEGLLKAPNGGASAVWASSALTEADPQAAADEVLVDALLNGPPTIGEATLIAQRATTDLDVRRTFMLFGDPAMRLKRAQ